MKKLFTTAAFALAALGAQAQSGAFNVYISEFMNNNPSQDSLEFIEIYNPNVVQSIDLSGFQFTSGINYTFPAGVTIAPLDYVLLAVDSVAFQNAYGLAAYDFAPGLNNSGEAIVLKDMLGNLVDSVDYAAAGWLLNDEASYELCNPAGDHSDFNNWLYATTGTGVVINGTEILATPGADNACMMPPASNYPYYMISEINGVDMNGQADSAGITAELRAVVHSVDFDGNTGLDFAFVDYTNTGIRVFSTNDISNYTVALGDSLHISGEITQFNGVLQIEPDSISVISSNNSLVTPMDVTELSEMTEGKMVRILNVVAIDTVTAGGGDNITYVAGTDTFLVRVDVDIDASGFAFTADTFNITGFGSQFDFDNPYTDGYQMFPRFIADFEEIGVVSSVVTTSEAIELAMFPNPANDVLNIRCSEAITELMVVDMMGRTAVYNTPMNAQTTVDVANLAAGVYQVVINTENGRATQLVVVE